MKSPEQTKYGSDDKYGECVGRFGYAFYFDECSKYTSESSLLPLLYRLAWSHGCPRPDYCVENFGGIKRMIDRYRECNSKLDTIRTMAGHMNTGLYNQINAPIRRLPDERVGLHEPTAVPNSHKFQIAPGAGVHDYALSRLTILGLGIDNDRTDAVLRAHVSHSNSLDELLARFANDLSLMPKISRTDILSHLLPKGILLEENCKTAYDRLAQALKIQAPRLVETYQELTLCQKDELGVADLRSLIEAPF